MRREDAGDAEGADNGLEKHTTVETALEAGSET